MSRFHSYISSAAKLIETYVPGKPLQLHLKAFFAADKKFGSRDRKMIASLCYYYFRMGHSCEDMDLQQRILTGIFLCGQNSNDMLQFLKPEWNEKISLPLEEKFLIAGIQPEKIFLLQDLLSAKINAGSFAISFLKQPHLFLRIRPGKKKPVIDKLAKAGVPFDLKDNDCIKLKNNAPADTIVNLNREAVVQDMNSQRVFDLLEVYKREINERQKIAVWDCCAASGGKAILLYDKLNGNIKLTVSDIRENILVNLSKRLAQAGISINRSFTADLTKTVKLGQDEKFSIIVCDAPCTGSGTWSRSPEQAYFFKKKQVNDYAGTQQQLFTNVLPHLDKNGLIFYITCSVFSSENEAVVTAIQEKNPALQLLKMEYLTGYNEGADTMFVALFRSGN